MKRQWLVSLEAGNCGSLINEHLGKAVREAVGEFGIAKAAVDELPQGAKLVTQPDNANLDIKAFDSALCQYMEGMVTKDELRGMLLKALGITPIGPGWVSLGGVTSVPHG